MWSKQEESHEKKDRFTIKCSHVYDEDGFPSGRAGGLLREKYPEASLKRLDKMEQDFVGPAEAVVRLPEGEYRTYHGAVAMNNETKEIIDISENTVLMDADTPGVYASSYHNPIGNQTYTADKAFDGIISDESRWNSATAQGENQWLEARYQDNVTMNKVIVYETLGRINKYQFQYHDGTDWVDIKTGTQIRGTETMTFEPVT